jgi:hypothetical protein
MLLMETTTMSTKTLCIPGAAALMIGGLVTAMAALSCDVETCETDPQPSVIVRFWTQVGSARVPVQADSVRFQVQPTGGDAQADLASPPGLHNGRCLDEACSQWALGSDQAGYVRIWAEACDRSYTAETSVELDAMACHALTQHVDIEVDGASCPMDPERLPLPPPPPPTGCDEMAHPSVHVVVAKRYEDYFVPVDVDAVWFQYAGHTFEARCLQGDQGCYAWIAGYELEGPITVSTEHCDTVVSETVTVHSLPDGCHVQTEYMVLEVSTLGCLATEQEDPPPPPPPRPWNLTSVEDPSNASAGAPTELTTAHHLPPPPGSPDDLASPG